MNLHLRSPITVIGLVLILVCGCRRGEQPAGGVVTPPSPTGASSTAGAGTTAEQSGQPKAIAPQTYESDAEQLLAMRLPEQEASQGWIRLFDGHTLFGWEIAGAADWRVEQGSIVVDSGEACLLCTSMPWQDYELKLEFKADEQTNSGVFLRTPLEPEDPATDCYEVNIAPPDNPFPTGSVVKRKKADSLTSPATAGQWRSMLLRLEGRRLQVTVDDQLVCDYSDEVGLAAARIGLQHNQGRVEFRNVLLRPLGLQDMVDPALSQWKKYPEMPGDFTVTSEGFLRVQGGRTQLESTASYDDFVLLAEYKLPRPEINSGIFFRCIPGQVMMGYECQLSNAIKDGNPLTPVDCGTGGIFRRQDARIVAGEVDQWSTLVLAAHEHKMAAWVGGLQVSDWYDDRPPQENPREGLRLEAGTIMIQGHDPTTEALLRQLRIAAVHEPTAP
jgi:hypothetical protein